MKILGHNIFANHILAFLLTGEGGENITGKKFLQVILDVAYPGYFMILCGETAKMGVPPGNPAKRGIRRRGRHPRTPGRTAISAVAAAES